MLHSPKNRTCPSCNCKICWNMRRQPPGDRKGKSPSTTSTRASASQNESPSNPYFFAGVGGVAMPPRMALKNSDDEGSSTIRSLLRVKLAL